MYEVLRTPEFDQWLDDLDLVTANRVVLVLLRKAAGNWGDYKPLPGVPGIFERRLMGRGPGIRLYFCRQSSNTIMMPTAGDKSTQQRRDIARAQRLRERYLCRSKIMELTGLDDYIRARIRREPEFGCLMRQSAIELLDGNDEDRRIALRILRDQLGLTEDEIQELERKGTAA